MPGESVVDGLKQRVKGAATFARILHTHFRDDGCRESAAALTYTSLFALVPVMTVSFTVLASVPALKEKGDVFQQWAFNYFVPSAGNLLLEHLQGFAHQATNLTGVGVIFLVVTAVMMLRTVEKTLNRIWRVRAPRKGTSGLLMYWAVLSLGPICLALGLAITSYLTSQALFNETVSYLGGGRVWLALLPIVFTTVMLTLLYVVVPNTRVPLKQGFLGALIAALFFEGAKSGFTFFIRQTPSYELVYGAFAAVPVFLLWIYISWTIVLAGAELVRTMVVYQEHRSPVPRMLALMRLLYVLWERQQRGKVLTSRVLRRVLRANGIAHWDEFRNLLLDMHLIQKTEDGAYVLSQDLRQISLAELVTRLPWPNSTLFDVHSVNEQMPWENTLCYTVENAQGVLANELTMSLDSLFKAQSEDSEHGPASRTST